jgi:hypothetical protein
VIHTDSQLQHKGRASRLSEKKKNLYIILSEKKKLQGDIALCTAQASWKAIVKALTDDELGFFLQTMEINKAEEGPKLAGWDNILFN